MQNQINALLNSFIGLVLVVVNFIQNFLTRLMSSPTTIMILVVLLFATRKGGIKVGKSELTMGK